MQENTQTSELVGAERRRVEAVVETLAKLRGEGESLAELAHDARNMVTALGLYCDLLEEPGVLATQFAHYGAELRLVSAASRRLVEKLVALDVRGSSARGSAAGSGYAARSHATLNSMRMQELPDLATASDPTEWAAAGPAGSQVGSSPARPSAADGAGRSNGTAALESSRRWDMVPPEHISNLAQELLASCNLLSALAGPSIALTVDVEGGALPVRLNAEDLTRILVNLVKNAAEAMPGSGSIRIALRKRTDGAEAEAEFPKGSPVLSLTIEDSGPGIARKALERVFEAGFTSRHDQPSAQTAGGILSVSGGWPSAHRGLGLSITRSIVEAAGGRIYATNREGPGMPGRGARFEIVLPVRSR